tara:strand:+ start:396 stop:1646 length:1251 start_codon:yes stop_codon:yes gene_type:complete
VEWDEELKRMIKRLGSKTGLTIFNNKGMVQLRHRPAGGKLVGKNLPFRYSEEDMDDAYIRIRNIYKLMEKDELEFTHAVIVADGKAPKPSEDLNWNAAIEEYRVQKITRGTAIKEETWVKEHQPVICDAVVRLSHRNSPDSVEELIEVVTADWVSGSRTREQRVRNLAAFLKFCVIRKRFPSQWMPPQYLGDLIGRKPPSAKSQAVDPISDQEIIDLISFFENWTGALRDKPHAEKWVNALKMLAVFGLRPEELKHLEKRTDRGTGKKFIWCSYRKRTGGGLTEPRKLQELPLVDEKGNVLDWNLVELFHDNLIDLPPLQAKTGPAEACRKYMSKKQGWLDLKARVEERGERLGTYSFRHSYSVRGHQRDIDGGSMASAMGHSYETHCREYPWATKSGVDKAFEAARLNRINKKVA